MHMLRIETCEENMRKKIEVAKSTFSAYKTKNIDCIEKNSVYKM